VEGADERLGQRGVAEQRSTRSPISLAALLVKVTARMESGATPFSRISQAMRLVMTRVLPEPAPGQNQQRAFGGLDGGALFGIQVVEERLHGRKSRREGSLI
jgi:hypothetical protein